MAKSPSGDILNSSHIIIPSEWQTDSSVCHILRCGWCAYFHDFMNHICLSLFTVSGLHRRSPWDHYTGPPSSHPDSAGPLQVLPAHPQTRELYERWDPVSRVSVCVKWWRKLWLWTSPPAFPLRMQGSTWLTCDSPVAPHLSYFTLCFRAEQMLGFSGSPPL